MGKIKPDQIIKRSHKKKTQSVEEDRGTTFPADEQQESDATHPDQIETRVADEIEAAIRRHIDANAPPRLIDDDEADPLVEILARKKTRIERILKTLKSELSIIETDLATEIKKRPSKAYRRGYVCVYIESTEKLRAEVGDETGEI